jgi:hypothetical protein
VAWDAPLWSAPEQQVKDIRDTPGNFQIYMKILAYILPRLLNGRARLEDLHPTGSLKDTNISFRSQ